MTWQSKEIIYLISTTRHPKQTQRADPLMICRLQGQGESFPCLFIFHPFLRRAILISENASGSKSIFQRLLTMPDLLAIYRESMRTSLTENYQH